MQAGLRLLGGGVLVVPTPKCSGHYVITEYGTHPTHGHTTSQCVLVHLALACRRVQMSALTALYCKIKLLITPKPCTFGKTSLSNCLRGPATNKGSDSRFKLILTVM